MNLLQTLSLSLALLTLSANAAKEKELGQVDWLRNYDQAVQKSEQLDKPILILFQEVPGCQGCIDYGRETLSHPLIVDAIENEFIPLAIRNNAAFGHDREILKRFKEPAWNFQVMRFINRDGKDIIPRKDRVWTPQQTAARMIQALEAANKIAPEYLHSVHLSADQSKLKTAAFSMFCFWVGEAKLGGIEGVIETEAGWLDGHEVVRLRYDPNTITWADLVHKAQSHGCANHVYAPDNASLKQTPQALTAKAKLFNPKDYRTARASDQKRHLQFSKLKALKLNPVQRTKLNAALSNKDTQALAQWLSPSQWEKLM